MRISVGSALSIGSSCDAAGGAGGGGFGGFVFGHAGLDVVEKGAKMRAGVSTQGRWRLVCVALVGLVRARVGYIRVGYIRVDHFGFAFDDAVGGLAR